jgi:hypothetical protein
MPDAESLLGKPFGIELTATIEEATKKAAFDVLLIFIPRGNRNNRRFDDN